MARKSKAEKRGTKMAKKIKEHAAKNAKLMKKSAKKFAKDETWAEHHMKNTNTFSA